MATNVLVPVCTFVGLQLRSADAATQIIDRFCEAVVVLCMTCASKSRLPLNFSISRVLVMCTAPQQ